MPKNTQMHTQWITVNGQSVPLVLPQYWDGEKWVVSSEQNPLPVKAELTRRNVVFEWEREILNSNKTIIVEVPDWATGAIVSLRIFGSTGSFESGEGLSLETRLAIDSGSYIVDIVRSDETTGIPNHLSHHLYVGAKEVNDTSPNWVGKIKSSVKLGNYMEIRINVSGTFENGEGFDIRPKIYWIE